MVYNPIHGVCDVRILVRDMRICNDLIRDMGNSDSPDHDIFCKEHTIADSNVDVEVEVEVIK
jgi:hypothetical protein